MNKAIVMTLGAVSAVIILSGCDSATKQSSPDPTSDSIRMATPKEVIGMPSGFRNVAEACDSGGNMILVTSRGSDFAGGPNGGGLGSGLFVIPNDPRCKR